MCLFITQHITLNSIKLFFYVILNKVDTNEVYFCFYQRCLERTFKFKKKMIIISF